MNNKNRHKTSKQGSVAKNNASQQHKSMQSQTEITTPLIPDSSTDDNPFYDDSETYTELILDDDEINTSSTMASFQPEKTPVMDKLAAVIPAALTMNPPASDWSLEKTILVDDDAFLTASLMRTDTKEVFALNEFPFIIGRSDACQLQIADLSLSRQHASINKSESGVTIQDNDSANGIKVNKIRVKQVILMDGDTITLGHVNLRFDLTGHAQNQSRSFALSSDWLDRFRLSRPNWTLIATVASIAAMLLAGLFYKSSIDDRVMVTEQPIAAKTPQHPKTSQQNTTDSSSQQPKVNDTVTSVADTQSESTGKSKTAQPKTTQSQTTQPTTVVAPTEIAALMKPISNSQPAANQTKPKSAVAATPPVSDKKSMGRQTVSVKQPVQKSSKTTSKPVKPATKPKKKTKLRIKRPQVTLQSTMTTARQLYQDGNVSKAIKLLNKQTARSRQPAALVTEAQDLQQLISRLHTDYQTGRQAYDNGDQSQAWIHWKTFLKTEKALELTTKSKYALAIQQRVRDASLARGKALEQTDSKAAYQHWQRAARLDPSSQASDAAAALEIKARDLYREGYRLEHANLAKAIQRWRQVAELAPPSSEYYTKAKAKLRFYEEMSQ